MSRLFSIIIPVYNRPNEVDELVQSLAAQEGDANFELIIVEDGSTLPSKEVVEPYLNQINIRYFQRPNGGRSRARNYGMEQAKGDYFLFFDSDCIIPPRYFTELEKNLEVNYSDCFGGPDAANDSFTGVQKAINYAMTSFLTTGGIRGSGEKFDKFKPRTFNMGFSRKVYDTVGGFRDMYAEDIDLVYRIQNAGFDIKLYQSVFVYHKRRVSFKKFFKQVYTFGFARINLSMIYKGTLKLVHTLPAFFLLGCVTLAILSILISPYFLTPIALYTLILLIDALVKTKKPGIALMALAAAFIQLFGYGWGFIRAFVEKVIFRRGLESSETVIKKFK